MRYLTVAGLVILLLCTGLVSAGTLTVSLEPSLDGNGTIKATSITNATLARLVYILHPGINPNTVATITDGTAQFNLSGGVDEADRLFWINNLYEDSIPTRIDDPTKDIQQFVGRTLRVSVIGNLSDPTYLIETFTMDQGYPNPFVRYFDGNNSPQALPVHGGAYTILSMKTDPPLFEVKTLGLPELGQDMDVIYYTPGTPAHPSTSTSVNPSFSKWMYGKVGHGVDYGGNDSKCTSCHGNLDAKPVNFSDITINNGFCFRCHYGKGGTEKGFVVDYIPGNTYYSATAKPATVPYTPTTTTPNPTPTQKAPAFEALLAVMALLTAILFKRR